MDESLKLAKNDVRCLRKKMCQIVSQLYCKVNLSLMEQQCPLLISFAHRIQCMCLLFTLHLSVVSPFIYSTQVLLCMYASYLT